MGERLRRSRPDRRGARHRRAARPPVAERQGRQPRRCFSTAPSGIGGYCPNYTSTQYGAGAAAPCVTFCNAHGTHVAGTAAGTNGVARGAGIIGIQVFHPEGTVAQSYTSDQLKGLERVYNLRGSYSIAAVNLSIGSDTAYTGTCDNLSSENYFVLLVGVLAEVGRDRHRRRDGQLRGTPTASRRRPACRTSCASATRRSTCWATTRSTRARTPAASSSLLAPGTHICSSVPTSRFECGWTGTSMAAPHVAGAFAALKQLRPWTTVSSSLTALQASGQPVTGRPQRCHEVADQHLERPRVPLQPLTDRVSPSGRPATRAPARGSAGPRGG